MDAVERAQKKLEAAKLRTRAAHQHSNAAAHRRQAGRPAYPGQAEICMDKAATIEALAAKNEAKAELLDAEAAGKGIKVATQKNTYYCWAEHTAGKSIDHSCSTGSFADPTDGWELEIKATNEDEAFQQAAKQFEKHARGFEKENNKPCACGRYSGALWDSWWDSQVVIVSRSPYPDYVSDENAD